VVLCAGDLAHGIVEGQAEDLDVEVDSVAGQITFGPAPIGVLDDQAGIGGQDQIAGGLFDELESALLEERNQRRQPGGADLLPRPARPARLTASNSSTRLMILAIARPIGTAGTPTARTCAGWTTGITIFPTGGQ
jgi:hypothetical protein